MNFKNPKQVIQAYLESCSNKVSMELYKYIILGVAAGAFVAFGASSSSAAVHAVQNVGIAKVIAGTIFPVGLMLIIVVGGELFTGNCMMVMGTLKRKYTILDMCERLAIVFLANFVGAVLISTLLFYSGQFDLGDGALGAYTIKVALAKSTLPFHKALLSGILCNILVCLAVLMAVSATDIVGKLFAVFFPIMAFVIGGFEHCVANMFYIPAGMLAMTNEGYVTKAMQLYGYTTEQLSSISIEHFFVSNLLPVTIGNIIGGMLCIGIPFFLLHEKAKDLKKNEVILHKVQES